MAAQAENADSRRRIVIVDDEQAIADSLDVILSLAGYDCSVTYSAIDAIDLVSSFQPHLVITDVVMPGMTGVELASQLRASHPALCVILFSGNAATQELLEEAGERIGPVRVLPKPFPPRELLRVVAEMTSRRERDQSCH